MSTEGASRDLLPALRAVRDAWQRSLEYHIERHKARIVHARKVETTGQEIAAEGGVEALEDAMGDVPSDRGLAVLAERAEGEGKTDGQVPAPSPRAAEVMLPTTGSASEARQSGGTEPEPRPERIDPSPSPATPPSAEVDGWLLGMIAARMRGRREALAQAVAFCEQAAQDFDVTYADKHADAARSIARGLRARAEEGAK